MMLDSAIALASLNAVFHSIDTVRMHGRTEVAPLTAVGFNPMHDYLGIARNDGHFKLFRQRDIENMRVDQKRSKICFPVALILLPLSRDMAAILDAAQA